MLGCVVVDDDEVTRELTVLFAAEAGVAAVAVGSGREALDLLREQGCPHAVLTDLRMPGIGGRDLAGMLREQCGPHTLLLAMSASALHADERESFDGFIRKPFTPDALRAALERRPALSEATFTSLAESMPRAQLLELYALCLDDADRRIERMREMVTAGDADSYERAAHAIKGGCGMVGALELAAMAAAMEQDGPAPGGSVAPLDDFLLASGRLRRILGAHKD